MPNKHFFKLGLDFNRGFQSFSMANLEKGDRHTCDSSLFRRDLPIFCPFLKKSPYLEAQNFPIYPQHVYGKSPYFEFQISLPKFKNSLLCLIILPIWETKSPYLSSQMYHMSGDRWWLILCLMGYYILKSSAISVGIPHFWEVRNI